MMSVRNRKGFTLIELIATIAIISILSVIAVFTFGKIRENSEDKANYVSREAIMKSAVSYANEYYNDSKYWVYRENNDTETFCVPILELVNKGLLKQDDIKNISYNFILLTRGYSNKTIINEDYDKKGICGGSTDSSANIQLVKVTTSSATVSAKWCDNNGLVNYTYGLFDKNDNEINNYVSKDNTYKFSGLTRNTKYEFKVKCNYQNFYSTNYSDGLKRTIGSTDLSFNIGNVKKDSDKIYKEVSINYTSKNIYESENAKYYFRVNSNGNKSVDGVYKCGNGSSLSDCESNTTTILESGYWYRANSKDVMLHIYNNSSIYAKVWDGEIYSTNKSLQIVLPTNPYVNISIDHKLYDRYNDNFMGEEDNIINYYTDNWMSMPNISWNVYGGYETISKVYYSNSGNNDDDYTNRRSANIDSKYICNSNSCIFDKSKIGNNGGMQQIKIVVTNKITRKNTIIYINVNLDKKAPTLDIINSSGENWTKDDIKIILNCSDKYSGIDKSTIKWKDNKDNKDWQSLSYDESAGDIWRNEGNRKGWYEVCDYAGNCVDKDTIIKIDKTSPKLTIDNPIGYNWTNQNITVKLKYSDAASGINPSSLKWKDNASQTTWKSLGNTNTSTRDETWSGEGDRIGTYEICDNVGNCTTASTPIKIDKTAPSKPNIDNPTSGNWSKGNFKLTLSSSDSYSGIAYYQYTYSADTTTTGSNHDINWVTYSNSAKNSFVTTAFTANRNQLVYVRVCDKVGNCSDRNSTYIKIDNIAPSISVTVKNNSASKSSVCKSDECSIDFNVGTWYNKKNAPFISWTISDSNETYTYFNYNSAGNYSSRTKYETKNVISTYEGTKVKNGSYEINSGGKRQVAVTVKDVAGNQTTVVINFDFDDISPTDPTIFTISNGNIVVSGSTDKESGFDHYFYSLWNSSWTTTLASGNSGSVSLSNITSAGTYHVYAGAMDKAGNASDSPGRTISVTNRSSNSYCASGYTYSNGSCYYATKASSSSYCSQYCYYGNGYCATGEVCHYCGPNTISKTCYKTEKNCIVAAKQFGYCYKKSYSYSCPNGGSLSGGYCYHYGSVYKSYYCPSGTTEYNGLCYSLS